MLLDFSPASRGAALGFVFFRAGGLTLKATVLRNRKGDVFLSPYRARGNAPSWDFADRGVHDLLLQELAPHLAALHRDEDRARAGAVAEWIEKEVFGRADRGKSKKQTA